MKKIMFGWINTFTSLNQEWKPSSAKLEKSPYRKATNAWKAIFCSNDKCLHYKEKKKERRWEEEKRGIINSRGINKVML